MTDAHIVLIIGAWFVGQLGVYFLFIKYMKSDATPVVVLVILWAILNIFAVMLFVFNLGSLIGNRLASGY